MDDLFSPRGLTGRTLTRSDLIPLAGGPPQVLVDCDLEEADLSGLDLTGWRFERCNLRKADCSAAKLEGSVWQGCRAPFVSFVGANLSEAAFSGGDFNNSVWRRATLTSAKFVGTKLTGADFTEARAMHVQFEEVLLVSAKLPGFSFRKETLRRVDLSGADVRKGDFRMTVFEDCSLREAMPVFTCIESRSKIAMPVHSDPVPQVVGQAMWGLRGPGTAFPLPMGAFT